MSGQTQTTQGRALGALEHYFWIKNQVGPWHFVVAAEIRGATTLDDWRAAFDAAQRRHPMLRVGIEATGLHDPHFVERPGTRIPLRMTTEHALESLIEDELASPFSADQPLLVRAAVLCRPDHATLLISAHHAVGDGRSVVYLIRDLLHALAGKALEALPLPPNQEALRPNVPPMLPLPPGGAVNDRPASILNRPRSQLHVEARRLPDWLGAKLRDKARAERTSVHGAIVAALVAEGAGRAEHWQGAPVRFLSPIDMRQVIGRGEEFALSLGIGGGHLDLSSTDDFWELARAAGESLAPSRSPEAFVGACAGMGALISTKPGLKEIAQFDQMHLANEITVSNLGPVPFSPEFGALRLEALWGPSVTMGVEGEQVVGVSTIGTVIHLVHTSYRPIRGLLEGASRQLVNQID